MADSNGANPNDEAASAGFAGEDSAAIIVPASSSRGAESGNPDSAASSGVERLPLLAYARVGERSSAEEAPPPSKGLAARGIAIATCFVLLTAVGATVAYDHVQNARVWDAQARRDSGLAANYGSLATRVASIEAGRGHEELGELRKVLNEVRSGASTARDVNAALGQLASRVDRIEKDQNARLDKLGDRIDHDAALRLSDIAARLDRLEKRPTVTTAALPPTSALPAPFRTIAPSKPDSAKPESAKAEPTVSNEVTSAIEKPKPRLRNFYIDEIRSDYALIEGPGGAQSVSQGDYIPGAGRVVRFERHGHDWIVVTSLGVIVNGPDTY